jgi:ankyrin repeat protein
MFSHHHEYFEKSEETKSLYSKLEEISKENERNQDKFAKELPQVVWKLPPMHAAVDNNKFGVWCFMYVLGGEAGVLNGQAKSCINLIIEKEKREKHLLESSNSVSKYLIKTATEMYGEYALHKAIKLSDNHLIKILIANGYDIDESDSYNKTPLLLALEVKNIDYIKLLLQHGASVQYKDLDLAASLKSFDCLKILLQASTRNTKCYEFRNTLLLKAAFEGNLQLLKLLIENNADINATDQQGKILLHQSALKGHLESCKNLIENRADVNAKDEQGQTPLHMSGWKSHFECLKYLIDNKADVNAKDDKGQTPLHMYGHLECIKYLIYNKADVNSEDNNGQTPLHKSSFRGDLECCKLLIENKADVNVRDKDNQTALQLSTGKGHLDCIQY